MQKAVIIIPTYNEQDVIAQTILAVFKACESVAEYQVEILVFDSSSTDNTGSIVQGLQSQFPLIHLVTEPSKQGLGHAYMQAMKYAVETLRADVVFEFDADGSHKPEYLPKMLQELHNGADVVVGSRYVKGGSIPANWGLHRKFLSIVGNWISRIFLSPRHKDWTSGFRGTKTDALQQVAYTELASKGYAYKLHLFWLLHKNKAKIVEYPIAFIDREIGYSKLPKNNMIESLKLVIWLRLQAMHYFIKMSLVGGVGMVLQLVLFNIIRHFMPPQYANSIAVEIAIISNFLLNNAYSFKDKKLSRSEYGVRGLFKKAVNFNVISLVSLLIQFVVMTIGVDLLGRGFWVENGFLIIGVGIASINNYFTYSRFIWKNKK